MPRMDAITARWEAVPPLSVSVAALANSFGAGLGKPKGNDLNELVDMLGGTEGMQLEKPAWLTT